MLPTINGKSFLEVTEDDLKVLVENEDYRESDYIVGDSNYGYKSECYVYDNRSVECFFSLRHALNMGNSKYPNGYIG